MERSSWTSTNTDSGVSYYYESNLIPGQDIQYQETNSEKLLEWPDVIAKLLESSQSQSYSQESQASTVDDDNKAEKKLEESTTLGNSVPEKKFVKFSASSPVFVPSSVNTSDKENMNNFNVLLQPPQAQVPFGNYYNNNNASSSYSNFLPTSQFYYETMQYETLPATIGQNMNPILSSVPFSFNGENYWNQPQMVSSAWDANILEQNSQMVVDDDEPRKRRRRRRRHGNPDGSPYNICVYCKSNGETQVFWKSHPLKNEKGEIMCTVLRKLTCPNCGETGAQAHSIRYCPHTGSTVTPQQENNEYFKNTRDSMGKLRSHKF